MIVIFILKMRIITNIIININNEILPEDGVES